MSSKQKAQYFPVRNRFDATGASISSYNTSKSWSVGVGGQHSSGGGTAEFLTTAVNTTPPTTEYEYKSVYSTKVQLRNGGRNWRIGDTVSVTVGGKAYTITVTGEAFGYSYISEASVNYTTPLNVEEGTLDVANIIGGLSLIHI